MSLFDWDEEKAAANQRKHGVTFEFARRVFADPFAVVEPDGFAYGERRWLAIGWAGGVMMLVVVHTVSEIDGQELVRIISARPATKGEKRRYEYDSH